MFAFLMVVIVVLIILSLYLLHAHYTMPQSLNELQEQIEKDMGWDKDP